MINGLISCYIVTFVNVLGYSNNLSQLYQQKLLIANPLNIQLTGIYLTIIFYLILILPMISLYGFNINIKHHNCNVKSKIHRWF